eukprot:631534-Pelagomonas_calceolata.AAC.2
MERGHRAPARQACHLLLPPAFHDKGKITPRISFMQARCLHASVTDPCTWHVGLRCLNVPAFFLFECSATFNKTSPGVLPDPCCPEGLVAGSAK